MENYFACSRALRKLTHLGYNEKPILEYFREAKGSSKQPAKKPDLIFVIVAVAVRSLVREE